MTQALGYTETPATINCSWAHTISIRCGLNGVYHAKAALHHTRLRGYGKLLLKETSVIDPHRNQATQESVRRAKEP